MHIYDTLVLGSGYFSVGYATQNQNTVICEARQVCDTGFYLPLRSFRHRPYIPQTDAGDQLLNVFHSLSLWEQDTQNTNGFEGALCKYIIENQLSVLLKCRAVDISRRSDGIYDVTVHTNEGLTHLYAKKILDTRNTPVDKRFTVLFVCKDLPRVKEQLLALFPGGQIEPAFYADRYALHIPAGDAEENQIKCRVYELWKSANSEAKILYMAPVFYEDHCANPLTDSHYGNPLEAFEAGILYAKEGGL